jgi:hypothetical protein
VYFVGKSQYVRSLAVTHILFAVNHLVSIVLCDFGFSNILLSSEFSLYTMLFMNGRLQLRAYDSVFQNQVISIMYLAHICIYILDIRLFH